MTDQYAIDIAACRARQQRLWNSQECSSLDSILATRAETVQWLTGAWVPPFFRSMAVLNRDGETVLVVPESCMSENFAADRVDCIMVFSLMSSDLPLCPRIRTYDSISTFHAACHAHSS